MGERRETFFHSLYLSSNENEVYLNFLRCTKVWVAHNETRRTEDDRTRKETPLPPFMVTMEKGADVTSGGAV